MKKLNDTIDSQAITRDFHMNPSRNRYESNIELLDLRMPDFPQGNPSLRYDKKTHQALHMLGITTKMFLKGS